MTTSLLAQCNQFRISIAATAIGGSPRVRGSARGSEAGVPARPGSCARISLLSLPGARPAGESLEGTACFVSSITLAEEEEDHAAN